MTLPRPPAFPVTESRDVGAFLSASENGVPIPNVLPRVDELETFGIEFPRLHKHQAEQIRQLAHARHGSVGWWKFNRKWIGAASDDWEWVRFAEPHVETEWVAPGQYAVRFQLIRKVDPLAA